MPKAKVVDDAKKSDAGAAPVDVAEGSATKEPVAEKSEEGAVEGEKTPAVNTTEEVEVEEETADEKEEREKKDL